MGIPDVWVDGVAYEAYVGRWSRLVAASFVQWLDLPSALRWVDVGSGTGAVTQSLLRHASASEVVGIDPSEGYVAYARAHVADPGARFEVGKATALAFGDGEFDAAGRQRCRTPTAVWFARSAPQGARSAGTSVSPP